MVVKGGALSLASKKPLYMQSRLISQMLSISHVHSQCTAQDGALILRRADRSIHRGGV